MATLFELDVNPADVARDVLGVPDVRLVAIMPGGVAMDAQASGSWRALRPTRETWVSSTSQRYPHVRCWSSGDECLVYYVRRGQPLTGKILRFRVNA